MFWLFQNPTDLLFSLIKGMTMATAIVLVGCYYGYTASGGPVGVGRATAKSMVLNIILVHLIGMFGTQLFWGGNPELRSGADDGRGRVPAGPQREGERGRSGEGEEEEFRYHTGTIRAAKEPDAIQFIEVHKAFGSNQVLRGLNMGLPENQISMIIGPSGTGKSVCIKHIVGLLYPD